jgi:hypothetical protein
VIDSTTGQYGTFDLLLVYGDDNNCDNRARQELIERVINAPKKRKNDD